jgi:tetratricopeptide (TPR) repeat protein
VQALADARTGGSPAVGRAHQLQQRDAARARAVAALNSGDAKGAAEEALSAYITGLAVFGIASHTELLPECLLLAKSHAKMGQRPDAAHYLAIARDIVEHHPYADDATNVSLLSLLAELYLLQDDLATAEALYLRYVDLTERLHGLKHLATSDCYNLTAAFYTHKGDYSTALDFCGKALVRGLSVRACVPACVRARSKPIRALLFLFSFYQAIDRLQLIVDLAPPSPFFAGHPDCSAGAYSCQHCRLPLQPGAAVQNAG